MVRRAIGTTSLVFLLMSGLASAAPRNVDAAFERLKTLVGNWQIEDADSDAEVIYYLTAEGSALVEEFQGMSSVYHMNGEDLMVTHYCGADNQPRMKVVDYDAARGILKFDYFDVTNLSAPEAYFTREIEIVFQDADHVEIRFNGLEAGEERPSVQPLRRK